MEDSDEIRIATPGMWAVCSRPHVALNPERNKIFETLRQAQEFLESFKEADKRGRLSDDRWVLQSEVVQVVGMTPGPSKLIEFKDFYPLSRVPDSMPAIDLHEAIDRAFDGREVLVTCYLANEWRFEEVEKMAWMRTGHEYHGRKHESYPQLIMEAVYDFDPALKRIHGGLSAASEAQFYTSWQLWNHVAALCEQVAHSTRHIGLTASQCNARNDLRHAPERIFAQLCCYAHEIAPQTKPSQETPIDFAVEPQSLDDSGSGRAKRLAEYKMATGNPSNRRIYMAKNSGIHKPQFYEWLKGSLGAESSTCANFENFLAGGKPPIPRDKS